MSTLRPLSVALAALALAAVPAAAAPPAFVSLFDGKGLTGWKARAGAERFAVKGGAIVAEGAAGAPTGLLCTERTFGDFVLEYEVQAAGDPPPVEAGVLLRAPASGAATTEPAAITPGLPPQALKVDRVGTEAASPPQSHRGRSGTLRGFQIGGWSSVRIEASGDAVTVAVGGQNVASSEGAAALEGALCLVTPARAGRLSFRKLRVQERGRRAWLPLFAEPDVVSLSRSESGKWAFAGGVLVGTTSVEDRKGALLVTPKPLTDYTVRLEYRLTAGNAGLYLRGHNGSKPGEAQGLQVDIDLQQGGGGLYDGGGAGWLVHGVPVTTPDGWHRLVVNVRGSHVAVHLDGARTAQVENAPGPREGYLGLELAPGAPARLEVRRFDVLSALIRPPVPGFPVGRCVRVVGVRAPEEAKAVGFEYLELALQDLLPLDQAAFDREVARLRQIGLPAVAGYGFMPADLKIVGPDVDAAKVDAALAHGLDRAAKLGLGMVVYGNLNGGSRKAPDGFAPDKAWAQLVDFGKRAAAAADKRGITVLFEPMPARQTNTVTTVAEALRLARAVNHPRFALLVDYGYVVEGKEELDVITQAARFIRLIEMSNPDGRVYPRSPDEADYLHFFRALAVGRYRGGFSVHAKPTIFLADAPRAIATLRELAATTFAR